MLLALTPPGAVGQDRAGIAVRPPLGLPPRRRPITCKRLPRHNTENVRRQRAQGLCPVQFWLPDTSTPEFAAEVARSITAVAKLDPEDEALLDQFERWATETLTEWPPPEIRLPEAK